MLYFHKIIINYRIVNDWLWDVDWPSVVIWTLKTDMSCRQGQIPVFRFISQLDSCVFSLIMPSALFSLLHWRAKDWIIKYLFSFMLIVILGFYFLLMNVEVLSKKHAEWKGLVFDLMLQEERREYSIRHD